MLVKSKTDESFLSLKKKNIIKKTKIIHNSVSHEKEHCWIISLLGAPTALSKYIQIINIARKTKNSSN